MKAWDVRRIKSDTVPVPRLCLAVVSDGEVLHAARYSRFFQQQPALAERPAERLADRVAERLAERLAERVA